MKSEKIKGFAILENGISVRVVCYSDALEWGDVVGEFAKCAKCNCKMRIYVLKSDEHKAISIHNCEV